MVKLRFLLLVTLLAVTSTQLNAAWRIVIDRRSLAAVSANMASQKLIEDQHNIRLDSIAEKQ